VGALLIFYLVGQCEASDKYIAEFEDMLKHSCGQKVAGFIAEYIQVGNLPSFNACVGVKVKCASYEHLSNAALILRAMVFLFVPGCWWFCSTTKRFPSQGV
jgi:hypothetical protein